MTPAIASSIQYKEETLNGSRINFCFYVKADTRLYPKEQVLFSFYSQIS
jgi:hypothetical protein